ncbi:hypothetical protein EMMF5_003181 [Cystobasidiomycetes sp. EMM_F5]
MTPPINLPDCVIADPPSLSDGCLVLDGSGSSTVDGVTSALCTGAVVCAILLAIRDVGNGVILVSVNDTGEAGRATMTVALLLVEVPLELRNRVEFWLEVLVPLIVKDVEVERLVERDLVPFTNEDKDVDVDEMVVLFDAIVELDELDDGMVLDVLETKLVGEMDEFVTEVGEVTVEPSLSVLGSLVSDGEREALVPVPVTELDVLPFPLMVVAVVAREDVVRLAVVADDEVRVDRLLVVLCETVSVWLALRLLVEAVLVGESSVSNSVSVGRGDVRVLLPLLDELNEKVNEDAVLIVLLRPVYKEGESVGDVRPELELEMEAVVDDRE